MKRLLGLFFHFSIAITGFCQELAVANLRCESRRDPLGVESYSPKLSWELVSNLQNVKQAAYRVLVADDTVALNNNNGNVWDSRKVDSRTSIQVSYGGKTLLPGRKYFWKLMVWDNKGNVSGWSKTATWQMGLPGPKAWTGASWIALDILPNSSKIVPFAHGRGKKEWGSRKNRLPLFRKDFLINKPVKYATAFVCGLGHFEMSINGQKTGDHFLDPGWTQYSKQALYVSFDITNQLKPGKNTVGVMLGNGFYYIPGERYRKLTGAYGYPKMIAKLIIEYQDGSRSVFSTNASWRTATSPVIFSSIFGGEDYDAGLEQPGWNTSSYDDSRWKSALITTGPALHSQMAEPLKIMERIKPAASKLLSQGITVYDLAQNISGIPSLMITGNKGDTVRITPAELINENGTANQKGSGGPSYFTYILKGEGRESWEPRFTYYGFRYLQVQCIAKDSSLPLPEVVHIEGLHTRNAAPRVGEFNCSNDLFNKTYALIDWAIKSNTMSVFTDCPHREKLGWLEETHLMGSSVQYNYDIAALCRKVIRDMMLAQTAEGLIPEIAPEFVQFEDPFRDSPEWGSAAIILPWYLYKWYGDKRTLVEAYDMMKRYSDYLQKKSVNNILSHGLGDWYDIGPNRPGVSQLTPLGVTATAIFYYDLNIMQEVARVVGKPADVKKYQQMASEVKHSFNEKYFDKNTFQYATGSQASNAMALYMGLVEPAYKDSVIASLVNDIRKRNNALTAGDIGYRYVLRALEDAGRADVIFDMNSRTDVPGYGYQLAHGATALTESWQAYPSVSNNHFMLGHLMEWFYAGLCGIKQSGASVAFSKIEIRPQPVGDVVHASASYQSPYGLVKSSWRITEGRFKLNVTIPPNSEAIIHLPGKQMNPQYVGSGNYSYEVKLGNR